MGESGHIKFFQLNCDGRKMAEFSLPSDTDTVLLLQEPRMVNGKPGTLRRRKFHSIESDDARAAIYVPDLQSASFLPHVVKQDLVAGILEWQGQSLMVASVYCHHTRNVFTPEWVELIDYCRTNKLPLLCGCDTNAHSALWFSEDENKRGRELEEFIIGQKLDVCNNYAAVTYVSKGPRGQIVQSTIDVTLTLDCPMDILEWKVHSSRFISDHKPITFKIKCPKVGLTMTRNYFKADWNKFQNIIQSEMPNVKDGNWSQSRIEDEVAILNKYIIRALDITCPKKPRKRKQDHPWWDEECEKKRGAYRALQRKILKRGKKVPTSDELDQLKVAQRQLMGAIHKARKNSWREFTSKIDSISDMSKLFKIISKGPSPEVGLIRKQDGSMSINSEESLTELLNEHFPQCHVGQKVVREATSKSTPLSHIPWINTKTVSQAIQEFLPHKSPGPDDFKPIVLQHLPEKAISRLVEVFKAIIHFAYTPKCWRTSRVVFITKPGKPDKAHPRTYRPLSLCPFLLKSLEKVVKYHLEDEVLPQFPMHTRQFAFQKDMGTDNALSTAVNCIEKGYLNGEFVIVVLLDIKGAFDNIKPDAIYKSMVDSNIPVLIRNWYFDYLTNRDCVSTLGQSTLEALLTKGCPQGAVLSPFLGWLLSMNKFLQNYDYPNPTEGIGFADDGNLVVCGPDPDSVRDIAQDAINKAVQWAEEHGLEFSPAKTAVLFLTKRLKYTLPSPLSIYGTRVPYTTNAKYLGVTLDNQLTWQKHIDNKVSSTKRLLMLARNALAHTWGPNPKYMKWLYTSVIRPRITYGCFVWSKAAQETHNQKKLRSVQRLGLAMIAPIRRSTPTRALEIIHGIEPLHLHIQSLAMATSIRLNMKCTWATRDPGVIGHLNYTKGLLPGSLLGKTIDKAKFHRDWNHLYTVEIGDGKLDNWSPEVADWCCFTDGSKMDEKCIEIL